MNWFRRLFHWHAWQTAASYWRDREITRTLRLGLWGNDGIVICKGMERVFCDLEVCKWCGKTRWTEHLETDQ
jgi:hypothetical protein